MSASARTGPRAVASVLDRLLDSRPDQAQDRPRGAAETMAELRLAVHRDLEALLNARRPWRAAAPAWPALRTSPLGHGMPDLAAGAFNDGREREALRAEVEEVIRRFEPRLAEVQVHLADEFSPLNPALVLRVDALLLVRPQPEPISFDTVVDPTTSDVVLRAAREG